MALAIEISTGYHEPLGASWDSEGVNFAIQSSVATRVQLCLYEPEQPERELARVDLPGHTGETFHGRIAKLPAGLLYGLRVFGPWSPELGQRCNPYKLLLDPHALAIAGTITWNDATRGRAHVTSEPLPDLAREPMDVEDSAPFVPRAVIVDPAFDWEGDRPPAIPWHESLIYELHVRGYSKLHPELPESVRGSYEGLAHPASIEHLQQLGVTAVELLPIHEFADDSFLVARGLSNYWGYSTLGYFAPTARYAVSRAPGAVVREFKQMVKTLHRAGIEVLLDVVYNHTCEGAAEGPSLSWKGIDNAGYYALQEDGRYRDVTGCANSISADKPAAARLILESMRYWVSEMHVDGFRFDLATTLGRDQTGAFQPHAELLKQIIGDPVLSRVKLIAEPWDLGPEGYRVGHFPAPLSEWNDKCRDGLRRFWRGDPRPLEDLSARLLGSPDVFAEAGRPPQASINFVTAHDGFTLHDLVSYERKHNEANQELNRDGSDHNESSNQGVEGETDDPAIVQRREQLKRNLLASLLLAQGVPMLLAGDELGRTQRGNNNAYCQDHELSWLHWQLDSKQRELLAYCRKLVQLRRAQPLLRQREFLRVTDDESDDAASVRWLSADARTLTPELRQQPQQTFGFLLSSARGESASRLLVLCNASDSTRAFTLPCAGELRTWQLELDSALPSALTIETARAQSRVELSARSLVVWSSALIRAEPGA